MLPVVHIYIDLSEAETWNYDEIDNLQGKINTGEYSMSKVIIIGGGAAGDRKSTRLNSSHGSESRMPSSA